MILLPSPNHDSRNDAPIDMLVMHYTGMKTGAEAIARLRDSHAKVSAHYVVEEDGRGFQLVEESHRAWHAGVASWRGHVNINARSIGIEIVNPGHDHGYRPFPPAQMHAVILLCKDILSRHAIPARNVVGHSDIAPLRKQDPGELFDWPWLAREGIGLIGTRQKAGGIIQTSSLEPQALAEYGYGIGQDEASLNAAITAFQRHFRPHTVNGIWDEECAGILAGLLHRVDNG